MTITQLKYFMEVAKTNHFTCAAENLFVSQSSLSYSIKELEKELEVPLFIRRANKNVELSQYGKKLLPFVESGLKMLEDGKNEIDTMKSSLHGNVSIGFFFSIALTVIPSLLQRYKADNPETKINFNTKVYHGWVDLREKLLSGECDLVISAGNISDGCKSIRIASHRLVIIVSKMHAFADRKSISLNEIRDETLILFAANSNMDQAIKHMLSSNNISPRILYVSDWVTQQLSVTYGNGIGIYTDVPIDENLFSKIYIDNPESILPIYLSWTEKRKVTKVVEYTKEYLIDASQELITGKVF